MDRDWSDDVDIPMEVLYLKELVQKHDAQLKQILIDKLNAKVANLDAQLTAFKEKSKKDAEEIEGLQKKLDLVMTTLNKLVPESIKVAKHAKTAATYADKIAKSLKDIKDSFKGN